MWTVVQTLIWRLPCGQIGYELSVMLVLTGRSEDNTQKMTLALRWEALLFPHLTLSSRTIFRDSVSPPGYLPLPPS